MEKTSILLCEDSEDIILLTKFFLKREGFEVEIARKKEEVFQKLSDKKPALILLDLNLAEAREGERITKQLKKDPVTKNIPILLFSAEEKLEEIARNAGANGFIQKPFNLEELLSILSNTIHQNT